jgi:hypothetical protein
VLVLARARKEACDSNKRKAGTFPQLKLHAGLMPNAIAKSPFEHEDEHEHEDE